MRVLVAERYQLDHVLGRGAMGEVWHATDLTLKRPVAVKLLQAGEASAAGAERFRLEAQTAARLNHPNVVGVYDFGSHEDRHYLVMELVDGRSLAEERRQRTVLDCQEAAALTAQAAAGLAAAHRRRVIHRDIKPGNLMVTADRTVKIADFGIARFADEATSTFTAAGKIIGSAAYLPPERALGRPAQPASDVYSLGCVLYELLTGRPPFTGDTALAVVRQHVDATPVPPTRLRPGIPAPLAGYVLLMLAKDPAQRPTAEQVAARLAGFETPQDAPGPLPDAEPTAPLAAPPPPVRPPTVPFTAGRRRRAVPLRTLLVLGCVAVFAAAVAAGAFLTSGHGHSSTPPAGSPATAPVTSAAPSSPSNATSAPTTSAPATAEDDHNDKDHEDRNGDGKGKGHGHKG